MFAHILLVAMFKAIETAGVEQGKFSITHSIGLVAMLLFLVFYYIFFCYNANSLQKSLVIHKSVNL